eukprot:m.189523 g.189523  ORF g.189523 m.189523 type:complete len:103 (-) comp10568_c0_seq4:99-407(-)
MLDESILDLSENLIDFDTDIFRAASIGHLSTILLHSNRISKLRRKMLESIPTYTNLELQNNRITHLEDSLFEGIFTNGLCALGDSGGGRRGRGRGRGRGGAM